MAAGMLGMEGAERLLARSLGTSTGLDAVVRSLPHNPTTEMDLSLWRASRELKEDGVEPTADHPAVRKFLDEYGHRAVRELDVGIPRWRDDPEYVLGVLKTYMAHGDEADPESHFSEGAAEAKRAAAQLIEQVRREKGALRARLLSNFIRWTRSLGGLRESPKFYTIRLLAAMRGVIRKMGDSLAASGILEEGRMCSGSIWMKLTML